MLTYKNIFQIAYVTADMDKALALFDREQGIKKFLVYESTTPVDKKGNTATLKVAMAYVGDVQVEILQPVSGMTQVWKAKVPAPPGIVRHHHMGYSAASLEELHALRDFHAKNGHGIAWEGGIEGVAEGLYIDTYDTLGHYQEYAYFAPAAQKFFADIPRF